MIVFDTSACIEFLRGQSKTKLLVDFVERSGDAVAMTTVSLFELLSPIEHRKLRNEEKAVKAFVRGTILLELDLASAAEASRIMGALLRLGIPINPLDTLISGIAVAKGAEKIVTADHDFEQVEKVADIEDQMI